MRYRPFNDNGIENIRNVRSTLVKWFVCKKKKKEKQKTNTCECVT